MPTAMVTGSPVGLPTASPVVNPAALAEELLARYDTATLIAVLEEAILRVRDSAEPAEPPAGTLEWSALVDVEPELGFADWRAEVLSRLG